MGKNSYPYPKKKKKTPSGKLPLHVQNQNHHSYLHNQLQFPYNNFPLNITNSLVTVVTNGNKLLLIKLKHHFFFFEWIPTSLFNSNFSWTLT